MRPIGSLVLLASAAIASGCGGRAEPNNGSRNNPDDINGDSSPIPVDIGGQTREPGDDKPGAEPSPSPPVGPSPGTPTTPAEEPPSEPSPFEVLLDPDASVCFGRLTLRDAIERVLAQYPELGRDGPLMAELPLDIPGVAARQDDAFTPLGLVFHNVSADSSDYAYVLFDDACQPELFSRYELSVTAAGCWQASGTPLWEIPEPVDVCQSQLDFNRTFQATYETDCREGEGGEYQAQLEAVSSPESLGSLTLSGTPNQRLNGISLPVEIVEGSLAIAEYYEQTEQGGCNRFREVTVFLSLQDNTIEIFEILGVDCPNGRDTSCSWQSFGEFVQPRAE